MRILITRPQEDAVRFAELLAAKGHEALCASLLTVQYFDGPELTFEGVSAILCTSANGVRALARRTSERDVPFFAVGPQTADAARAAGFRKVECTDGDAAAMAAAMMDHIQPDEGMLVHAASADNEGRLKTLLAEEGYRVHVEVLYEVIAIAKLPDAAREAISQKAIDGAVVFSPRSAMALADCIQLAGLTDACRSMSAICISQAAADGLKPLPFARIVIAAKPNQAAMLDAVEQAGRAV
jgi:Uroporphyrinogen-III synthase